MAIILNMQCTECGETFPVNQKTYIDLGFPNFPKRCPTCLDRKQNRPSVVLDRKQVQGWKGVTVDIPFTFEEFKPFECDRPVRRHVLKGERGQGVSWSGRLDIYSYLPGENVCGQVADIRLMEVIRNRKVVEKDENEQDVERVIEGERQQYLVLEPSEEEEEASDLQLVWLRADYKTTLKGLGRQYHSDVDVSPALWAKEFSSSCRSGRFGSKMALAIVSPEHPAREVVWGDVEREEVFPVTALA